MEVKLFKSTLPRRSNLKAKPRDWMPYKRKQHSKPENHFWRLVPVWIKEPRAFGKGKKKRKFKVIKKYKLKAFHLRGFREEWPQSNV